MKPFHTVLLSGVLALALGACSDSDAPVSVETPASEAPAPDVSAPTAPVALANPASDVVNSTGVLGGISKEEAQKRTLIYSAGASHVFQATNNLLTLGEIERREMAGIPVGPIDVLDAEVDAEIEKLRSESLAKNPGMDFWQQVESMGYTKESFQAEKRRHMVLVRLFFPPEPEEWPLDLLKEIFGGAEQGNLYDSWIAGMPDQLIKRREAGEDYSLDTMTKQMFLLPQVMRWLYSTATIKEPFDGLPEGTALSVNGNTVSTDELMDVVEPLLTPVVRERAARWLELRTQVGAALIAQGTLMAPAEAQALIDEDKKEYAMSPISYEQVALQVMGFPSMQIFKEHFQLRRSFGTTLPSPLPLETMKAHAEKRKQFLGDGKVNAEVILFSALAPNTNIFPMDADSFAIQESRASEAAAKLADGVTWKEIMDEYSDYPDAVPGTMPGAPQPKKGRFGAQSRNPLRQFLGENDYMDFLQGYSIGEDIFFNAELGQPQGPIRGPFGWYMYQVKERTAPAKALDVENDERQIYLVSDDYLSRQFLAFVAKLMGGGQ